jgi:hypothetical protein
MKGKSGKARPSDIDTLMKRVRSEESAFEK